MLACAVVLALLLAVAALTWEDGSEGDAATAERATASAAEIARRVEDLRGLDFERVPSPQVVSPEQARREGLADLDRDYPPARRRADETVLALLGLVPPETDLRETTESILGTQVAGYYDPRSGRLRVVEGSGNATSVLDEITLSHELTHALEDQAIGLRTGALGGSDDTALAYLALVEGSATAVMFEYADRHLSADEALAGLLPSLFAGSSTEGIPPFILAQLAWPYTGGQAFVQQLHRRAGGRWTLVDLAHRERRPDSTEQILHPEKWLAVEKPLPVRLRTAEALGEGWRRAARGVLGEWATGELLRSTSGSGATAAAEGWGGDRYELWRTGAADCPTPCPDRAALVLRWRWDTPADQAEFAERVRAYVTESLDATPAGPSRWSARAAGVAMADGAEGVTLAFAPTPALAARLARTG